MLSKILISVAALLILAGLIGLKMKTVGKRLVFVCVAAVGMVFLSVAEMNTYGLVGGGLQGIYRILALVPGILVLRSICRCNQVTEVEALDGIGRRMPYTYALLVFLSVMIIGIPITGTFTGIIYSEIGLLAGGYGVFTYVGFVGNVLGVVVPVMLLFPMLRRMYFPVKEKTPDMTTAAYAAPSKPLLVISWLLAAVLLVFSLYQQPVLVAISTVMQKFFS